MSPLSWVRTPHPTPPPPPSFPPHRSGSYLTQTEIQQDGTRCITRSVGTRTTFHHLRASCSAYAQRQRRRQKLDPRVSLLTEVGRMGCPRCASPRLLSLPIINTIMPPCFQSQIPNCQTTSHHVRTSSSLSLSLSVSRALSLCVT